MNNEERDSQLSAMFDDELPEAECELLARRLARDEALKARWGRYATIGAAIRAERGLTLENRLALRVASAVSTEPSLASTAGVRSSAPGRSALVRWGQPAVGAALAAGVAMFAVLWMRDRSPTPTLLTQQPTPIAAHAVAASPAPVLLSAAIRTGSRKSRAGTNNSYTVPVTISGTAMVPPAQLANYVVAHSQFAMPWLRGTVLSSLDTAESATSAAPPAQSAGMRDAAEAR